MVRQLPTAAEAARILAEKRSRPPRRPPPPAGRALRATLKALDTKFGKGADGLKGHWSEIVGQQLARRTEPVRVSTPRGGGAGSLEIRVDGPSALLIQHQAGEILSRVNLFLGPGSVERLRIVQGPLRNPVRAGPRPPPRPKGPLDAAREQELSESLADVPDGPLKESLRRLGREVMRGR
ncbi:MAG TPA: DciA family protein [Caulobacteraceae bacterium]|jgi:hypothetical protein